MAVDSNSLIFQFMVESVDMLGYVEWCWLLSSVEFIFILARC